MGTLMGKLFAKQLHTKVKHTLESNSHVRPHFEVRPRLQFSTVNLSISNIVIVYKLLKTFHELVDSAKDNNIITIITSTIIVGVFYYR